ncbi:hypothetical protein [Microbacterium gorillae]|uniref:hypothetical protein n=1 Tax=Microbacterium gorillae TaxID=1231063 RepID=UPI000591599D|nr:hypothetical protein [Microbacterium gorillae]
MTTTATTTGPSDDGDLSADTTQTTHDDDAIELDTNADADADDEGRERGARDGNAEAARRRKQLRAAEAERDDYRGQVDALTASVSVLRRQMAEHAIEHDQTMRLQRPADLWDIGGYDAADLTGEDGRIDPEKVRAAAETMTQERPYLGKEVPGPGDPHALLNAILRTTGESNAPGDPYAAWGAAVKR